MRAKRKINELVKDFPIDMNGLNTKVDVKIIPLVSHDYLIDMDWLEKLLVFHGNLHWRPN
jgi:hypothetical protein